MCILANYILCKKNAYFLLFNKKNEVLTLTLCATETMICTKSRLEFYPLTNLNFGASELVYADQGRKICLYMLN